MAYVAPERLTLLPFPQAWTDGVLSLNAVVLPRGTPMEPLMTGVPGVDRRAGVRRRRHPTRSAVDFIAVEIARSE